MNVIGTFLMVGALSIYHLFVINTVKMAVFTQKWSNFPDFVTQKTYIL